MKAVVCKNRSLSVEDVQEPKPGKGQVLVNVLRNGICGSDLHMLNSIAHTKEILGRTGDGESFPEESDAIIFGHEYCAEVAEYGSGCRKKLKPGTRVVAPPIVINDGGIDAVGLSKNYNGAYSERFLLQEDLLIPVPDGLSSEMAALTEPMAVGLHAVNQSEIKSKDLAVVIGCGPIGLAVISALKAKGVRTIIASDFSPGRRNFAKQFGADIIVDPAIESPFSNAEQMGYLKNNQSLLRYAADAMERLNDSFIPTWQALKLADKFNLGPKGPVVFECVGAPGVLQSLIETVPMMSRIMVLGACLGSDKIEPAMALNKELDIRFSLAWTPAEYKQTLHWIADGKLVCKPMITGEVGLDGVGNAFEALKDPEQHAKILINPKSAAVMPEKVVF